VQLVVTVDQRQLTGTDGLYSVHQIILAVSVKDCYLIFSAVWPGYIKLS